MRFVIDILIVLSLLFLGFFLYVQYGAHIATRFSGNDAEATIYIDRVAFSVQIAATEEKRVLGLSGQSGLPQYGGMLFIFPEAAKHGFWMKDMQFPIDILWFDSSLRLVHIERDVSPDSYPTLYAPRENAQFVVEINANMAARTDIALGDSLTIPPELIPRELR